MELTIAEEILNAYGFEFKSTRLTKIGSGHINRTYLLSSKDETYILQNINTQVFKAPWVISNNIDQVAGYLKKTYPTYLFPAPIPTIDGSLMYRHENEYWRLLPFVTNTVAFDTLTDPIQAYEAAKQFGKLTRLLDHFDTSLLKPTIENFHNLKWRFEQFKLALHDASHTRRLIAKAEIENALTYDFLISDYESIQKRADFPDRPIHHDTKISNVLLSEKDNSGVCVIDLDTLMPGKFISDLGDMMRTYLCAFSENETDLTKISIRLPYFEATIKGYLSEMKGFLSETEKEVILFSGKYIIYMQAVRFLSDYLNGDIYFPITYQEQNLDRSKNQFKLLAEIYDNEHTLQDIIDKEMGNRKLGD